MPATKALARLDALSRLGVALSRAVSRREVASVVVERLVELTGADVCTVHGRADDGGLELLASRGIDPSIAERLHTSAVHPSEDARWAEDDARSQALFPELVEALGAEGGARSFGELPLTSEGVTVAVACFGARARRTFPPDERAFLATFASQCATAMRRAEQVERERAAQVATRRIRTSLETTLRSIGDAVITTDRVGRITLVNPIAEALTGWREIEALGQPIDEVFRIVEEESRRPVPSPVARALRDGAIVGLARDAVLLSRDGSSTVAVEDSAAPIRGPDGTIEGAVLVFRDVTEQRQREARRALLESAASALAEALDPETTLSRIAAIVVPRLADWCVVELLDEGSPSPRDGAVVVAHVSADEVALVREHAPRAGGAGHDFGVGRVLQTLRSELHEDVTEERLLASGADAEQRESLLRLGVRSVLFAPLVARGRVLGVVTLAHAASGRRYGPGDLVFAEELAARCAVAIDNARLYAAELVARRAAVVANRTKDVFLAMMSHELRTPLNSILGWSKLIMGTEVDPALRDRGLDVIHRNTVAMGALIEDLLDLSRIASGKIRLDLRLTDLARVVDTAIESVRAVAADRRLTLVPSIARGVPPVRGDATRLQQVISNLLSNACKFTPEGGRIDVSLRLAGGAAEVVVRDTGRGIDARFLPHVFELFQQEEGDARREHTGLGLGLSIVRRIVELHGGSVAARSEGPGLGAEFTVRIPVARSDERSERRATGKHAIPSVLEGIHVLAVDDDDDTRAFVRAALEMRGATVVTASGVDEALAVLDAEGPLPHVVLTDLGMPTRDGYSLLAELRSRSPERGGGVPVAAVSAFAYAHDRDRALEAGFAEHVAKPVDPQDLAALVLRLRQLA